MQDFSAQSTTSGDGNGDSLMDVFRALRFLRLNVPWKLLKLTRVIRVGRIVSRFRASMQHREGMLTAVKYLGVIGVGGHWCGPSGGPGWWPRVVAGVSGPAPGRLPPSALRSPPAAHLRLACLWFWIGRHPAEGDATWILRAESSGLGTFSIGAPIFDCYIVSLYWALTTMSTIGFGDIVPVTSNERLLAIFGMICGAIIFTFGLTQVRFCFKILKPKTLGKHF